MLRVNHPLCSIYSENNKNQDELFGGHFNYNQTQCRIYISNLTY